MKRITLFIAVIALLAGCAQLGMVPAKSFEEKLAYAYSTHTAVLQTAASAVTLKQISKEDGMQVLKLADESRSLLDAARIVGDPTAAQNKLVLATTILTQLQAYLRSKQ